MKLALLATILVANFPLLADVIIYPVKGETLPYELSEKNYDNSASNYDNSLSNYDNSESNYNNAPSNYDNSKTNPRNGKNGKKRIIRIADNKRFFAGYYVLNADGVTNFFSTEGKRIFYNPEKGVGLYCGISGKFCGVIATVQGETKLALTETGMKRLLL